MTDASFTSSLNSPPVPSMRESALSSLKTYAARLAPPLLLAVAAYVLWRELHGLSLGQIRAEILGWGLPRLGLALLMAATSYVLLAADEQLDGMSEPHALAVTATDGRSTKR